MAKFKELTGITLDINFPAHSEYQEKVNISFTAGTIPDVILLPPTLYSKYASFGALADLTDLYETSKLKNNYISQGYVDGLRLDGKLYGIPYQAGNGTITYLRGDWLTALDMDLPTNYSEFLDMLRAFRDSDLDGNGKNDTIALTAPNLVNTEAPLDIYLREFYQTATPDFKLVDGKYVDGMLENDMIYALNRLTSAFEEGLIDKEVLTNTTTTAREKFYLGNIGAFNYWAGNWHNNIQVYTQKYVPDVEIVAMPPIQNGNYIERVTNPLSITHKCDNIEGVFKYFFEFALDGGVGQHLFTYGIEGVTYDMVDDKMVFRKQNIRATDYNKSFFDGGLNITNFEDIVERPELLRVSNEVYHGSDLIYATILPPSTAYSNYITDLNDMRRSAVNKIVYGDVSIDDGLAEYAAASKGYVDAILAEFNK